MTAGEEKEKLERWKDGDLAARNVLIERNMRLVAHVAKKYAGEGREMDDLISVGTIGLIKAISTFDYTKRVRLATYAARCIDNELLMLLRSKKKFTREVSLYDPIGTDKEGNEISLLDIMECPPVDVVDNYYKDESIRILMEHMPKILNEKEYHIICLRYGLFDYEPQTQQEIANSMKISRSYVSRIEKTALEKLRTLFPEV